MSLLDAFPKNPFQPTLQHTAQTGLPIKIPWTNKAISLGTAFSSSATDKRRPFLKEHPFSDDSLNQSSLVFTSGSQGSLDVVTGSASSSSYQHVQLSIAGEIETPLIDVSARVNYEKKVTEDKNASCSHSLEIFVRRLIDSVSGLQRKPTF